MNIFSADEIGANKKDKMIQLLRALAAQSWSSRIPLESHKHLQP